MCCTVSGDALQLIHQDVAAVVAPVNQNQLPIFQVVQVLVPVQPDFAYESLVVFVGVGEFFRVSFFFFGSSGTASAVPFVAIRSNPNSLAF